MACAIIPDNGTFASSLVAYADCQARTIGEQGYLALSATGSSVSQLITILLSILIAIQGYRLLFGAMPTVREGVMTLIKIGAIFAFATGWPAYQAMVYNVAIMAPTELGATIGGIAALPGSENDLGLHLDAVDQQFQLLAIENASRPSASQTTGTALPQLFAGFDTFALGSARIVYLIGSIGSYTSTRLIAGVLLALGPLFIAFLLFDTTRGLMEGWLRVLSGAVVGTLMTSLILGVQLAFLEPWLTTLIAQRAADMSIAGAAGQLLAAATLFALTLGAAIAAAAKLTWSLRFPTLAGADGSPRMRVGRPAIADGIERAPERTAANGSRSRALAVADAISTLDRRETAMSSTRSMNAGGDAPGTRMIVNNQTVRDVSNVLSQVGPVGGASRRRGVTRVSASVQRRDRTP